MQLIQHNRFMVMCGEKPQQAYCVHTTLQPSGIAVSNEKNIDADPQPDCVRT